MPSRDSVVIVGAGPTGCTLALLLARHGVGSTLIERRPLPQRHPAACILNTRTMEVFREIGIEPRVRGACQDIFAHGRVTWVVSLAGRELGSRSVVPDNLTDVLAMSPTHTVQFPQHMLERLLWDAVERQPLIDFRTGHRLRAVDRAAAAVVATIEPARGEDLLLRPSYLIACDGASSGVRRALAIGMDGPILQDMIGIHFRADVGHLVNHRKSILYWVLNPQLVGVLIAHWLPTEWVLFTPYFPPQQTPDDFTDRRCRELIRIACGLTPPDLEVESVGAWALSARLARSFRDESVFLAGDAAHTFPPTGGLGLNTGVQDAHNLAWKLAAVVKGVARLDLLDTYETERRPVARVNLDHSARNFFQMNALTRIVGLDLADLGKLRAVQRSRAFGCLPSRWQRTLVGALVTQRLQRLSRLDREGRAGDELRAQFRALLPEQDPHYRSLGLDLGFSYGDGAVVPEPTPKPQGSNPVVDYVPTTWPGARLPHLSVRRNGERIAMIDVAEGRLFLVLTHPTGRPRWREAADAVQRTIMLPICCWSIGPEGSADLADEEGVWRRLSGIGETGAIVVRPDGHVAWRCADAPADPAGALEEVMRKCGAIATSRQES